jgi:hypothetical protein
MDSKLTFYWIRSQGSHYLSSAMILAELRKYRIAESITIENKLCQEDDTEVVNRQLTHFAISESQDPNPNNMTTIMPPKDLRYYPSIDEDQIKILCREYLIYTHQWTPSTTVAHIHPMSVLRNRSSPANDIINKFRYWRTDIDLRIQLVCPAQTYGAILGQIVPGYVGALSDNAQYGFSGFTLAVTDQESIVIDMPWTRPFNVFDNHKHSTSAWQTFGTLILDKVGLATLLDTGAVVEVNVFAAYKNPIFFCPTGIRVTPAVMIEGQMLRRPTVMETLESVVGVGMAAAATYCKQRGATGTFKDASAFYEQVKSWSSSSDQPSLSLGSNGDGSGVKQSLFGDLAGLYNRNNLNTLTDVPHPGVPGDMYFKDEIPHDIYERSKRFYPIDFVDSMVEHSYPCDPVTFGRVVNTDWATALQGPEFLPEFTQWAMNFRFWRGSMKFRVQFFTSSLMSARVLLAYIPTASTITPTGTCTTANSVLVGDYWTNIVTVRGTTETIVEIPYMRSYPWEVVSDHDSTGYFLIRVLSKVPTTVPIACIVSQAMGDDFLLKGLNGGYVKDFQTGPPVFVEGQGKFGTSNAPVTKICDGNIAKLHADEAFGGNIYDLIQRYSQVNFDARHWPYWEGYMDSSLLDRVSAGFKLFHGNIDYKLYFDQTIVAEPIVYMDNNQSVVDEVAFEHKPVGAGSTATDTAIWKVLDFSIPYYSKYDFMLTGIPVAEEYASLQGYVPISPIIESLTGDTTLTISQAMVKAGSDFRFYVSIALSTSAAPLYHVVQGLIKFTP